MQATHSSKLINSTAQQDAVCADIIDVLDKRLISSQSVKLTQKYWSCPRNAADIKLYKDTPPIVYLPPIQDARAVKQLLIPTDDWHNDSYVAVSPLESLGLLHELYTRLQNAKDNIHKRFLLEPTIAAWANHGELVVRQKGRLYLLQRGLAQEINTRNKEQVEPMVCLSFVVQNANVCSGFLAYGHPSICAVGGLVHSIERAVGDDIQFALGLNNVYFEGQKRYPRFRKSDKQTVWSFTNELTATLDVHLLLKSKDLEKLYQYLQDNPFKRFAGGSVWDCRISIANIAPVANYIIDDTCYANIKTDILDYALFVHSAVPATHHINCVGYATLELPSHKDNSRENYPHAWAEPLYAVTKQENFSKKAWWTRTFKQNHVIWSAI